MVALYQINLIYSLYWPNGLVYIEEPECLDILTVFEGHRLGGRMLISNYGLFWQRKYVDFGHGDNKGTLLGKTNKKKSFLVTFVNKLEFMFSTIKILFRFTWVKLEMEMRPCLRDCNITQLITYRIDGNILLGLENRTLRLHCTCPAERQRLREISDKMCNGKDCCRRRAVGNSIAVERVTTRRSRRSNVFP